MVKFSPREDILFSCSFDETIKVWDLDFSKDDFILINTLKNHGGTVWYIEFNKNGDKFLLVLMIKVSLCGELILKKYWR